VSDASLTCTSDTGCQQYQDVFYSVGDALTMPQEGVAFQRQTPDYRKFMNLVAALLDPADPANFAPYFMMRPIPPIPGQPAGTWPHAVLDFHDIGDPLVPTGEGNQFSRVAGAIPFLTPDAATKYPEYADYATPQALFDAYSGKTPNQVLVENHVLEGLSRLARTPAGSACGVNYIASAVCTAMPSVDATTCQKSLFDSDWLGQGAQLFDQQHLAVPLRLARREDVRADDAGGIAASWQPRLQVVPLTTPDAKGWQPSAPLCAVINGYMAPKGQHVWTFTDPCKAWDDVMYMENQMSRFLGSSGKDLYFMSHPATHECMANRTCDFFQEGN
jgi:hypothetical protein